ncbi:histidine kinase [Maribellus sp. CM-23]|uniref:sensor histidine kinase n=1 Tax=Maribellus sp. CM-23 TaxID=2781026 RepID=UPI001F194304|nr:histidine kinase [Maribellus sp. CM-23]MCE4565949.1 histidine kinase [Maribellus sp. CM-23]
MKRRQIWFRLWVVFLIHLVIKSFDLSFPNGPFEISLRSLVFSLFFLIYGMGIWYGADRANHFFQRLVGKQSNERKRIALLTLLHAVFGFVLLLSFNHLYRLGDIELFNNGEVWESVLFFNPELTVSLLCIYLIVVGFDGYFQTQKRLQEQLLRAKELEKENILAQYKALKAQIEPHFLFNSLSVLSSLVYEDADLSADFIVKMSKTLRYIIEKNEFHLVTLSEELEFLKAYFFLIKIRLGEGVFLDVELEKKFVESTFIPPVTLQLLVENAVVHNKYNPNDPLRISIRKEGNHMIVCNNLNLRNDKETSTQTGLKNLSRRYELLCGQNVEAEATANEFVVRIPVLNTTDYERFNI